MTFLSRKADYALLILSHLSQNVAGASARGIAEQFDLSRPFVANILKELHHAGLVSSSRGVNGGYGLKPTALDVTFADLLEAIHEGFRLTVCSDGASDDAEPCSLAATCPVKNPLAGIHRRIAAVLSGVTLRDLLTPAAVSPAGLPLIPLLQITDRRPTAAPDPHPSTGA